MNNSFGLPAAATLAFLAIWFPVVAHAAKTAAGSRAVDTKGQTMLVCQSQARVRYLAVNPLRRTVNGQPAEFSDVMIHWSSEDTDSRQKKLKLRHEINRLDFTYRYWVDGVEAPDAVPTFNCDKAPAPKI